MGIDIYLKWKGMTEEEKQLQYTGFSIRAGKYGYLREAYHGGPYATRILIKEAFEESNDCQAEIPASTMRQRLPEVLATVIARSKIVYDEEIDVNDPTVQSFVQFVELAELKEEETGQPCIVIASY